MLVIDVFPECIYIWLRSDIQFEELDIGIVACELLEGSLTSGFIPGRQNDTKSLLQQLPAYFEANTLVGTIYRYSPAIIAIL